MKIKIELPDAFAKSLAEIRLNGVLNPWVSTADTLDGWIGDQVLYFFSPAVDQWTKTQAVETVSDVAEKLSLLTPELLAEVAAFVESRLPVEAVSAEQSSQVETPSSERAG